MAHANGPQSHEQLKQYCLRQCGSPVIDINVDDQQVDDSIDDALAFFSEYHHDVVENVYVRHELTQTDVDRGYMILPENITDVARVFNPTNDNQTSSSAMFNVEYQLRLNDIWDTSSIDMTYYYLTRQYINFINDIINTRIRFTYNQYTNELHLLTDFNTGTGGLGFRPGQTVLIEAYSQLHPDVYSRLWGHWVLRSLAAAYVKRQWGMNLMKFQDMQLPGGVTMNGEQIMQQANEEIDKIKEEFIMKYQEPDEFIIR